VNDKRLDAKFLRDDGEIDDYFTLSKEPAPLQFVSISVTNTAGSGVVTITWNSTLGANYQVWRADSLDEPISWTPVAPLVPATGSETSWSEVILAEQASAFYRVSRL
jgi:hypothetical protein